MKIALINSRLSTSSVPPTGLMYIGGVLRKDGHFVKIYDYLAKDIEIMIEHLANFSPDLVGISFLTTEYQQASLIARRIRNELQRTIICAGGYHATALPERTLRELNLDFVVLGEGEMTMNEICCNPLENIDLEEIPGVAFLKNGVFIKTRNRPFIEDIDLLPFPARDLIVNGYEWYLTLPGAIRGHLIERVATIVTSRGCPGNCIFCAARGMWTNRVRRRSVNNILDEIEYLISEYNIGGLFFIDDTLTTKKSWVLEFCREWKKRGIKLAWGCNARVNIIDDEIIIAMKEVGCLQLDFGVESGSIKILKRLHKGQTPYMVIRAFDIVHRHGIQGMASFIVGTPGEDKQDIEETRKLAKRIKPYYVNFNILVPLPGSPLFEEALREHWLPDKPQFDKSWSIRQSNAPVMTTNFTREELLQVRKKLEDAFIWSNYMHLIMPLLKRPKFFFELLYIILSHPWRYLKLFVGFESRHITGFIERLFYDYKEYACEKIAAEKK